MLEFFLKKIYLLKELMNDNYAKYEKCIDACKYLDKILLLFLKIIKTMYKNRKKRYTPMCLIRLTYTHKDLWVF